MPLSHSKNQLGKTGEDLATSTLQKKGYKIIERNFHCPLGELDIIAYKKGVLCFIEVKTRSSDHFGSPEEAVSRPKQKRLARMARYYLQHKRINDTPCSFNVVSILMNQTPPQIDILEDVLVVNDILSAREC